MERTYFDIMHIDVTITLSIIALIFTLIWFWDEHKNGYIKGIPGPAALPILGNILQLTPQPHIACNELWRKYGDVFQIRMGSLQVVVINGISLIRKAYTSYGETFGARPDFLTFHYIGNGESLTFGRPKPEWNFHKKLARTAIRKHIRCSNGAHTEVIQAEVQKMIKALQEKGQHGAFDPNSILQHFIRSATFHLIFGGIAEQQYDKEYHELMALLLQFNDLGKTGLVPDIFPWTRRLFKGVGKYLQFQVLNDKLERKVQSLLDAHSNTMNEAKTRDFADAFLHTAKNVEDFPTANRFVNTVQDLMGGSESTMNSVVSWGLHLLGSLQDVQEKAQKEIDNVIGKERLPMISDRRHMPYMEAIILEILRYGCILPFSLPHCTTKTVNFAGYNIPKNTVVLFNSLSIARDENQWENENTFNPGRFLNADTGRADLGKKSRFLPFGAGSRRCLGQLIAEEEMFLIFTSLLQRCRLTDSGDQHDRQGILDLSLNPRPYKIHVYKRL